MSAGVISAHAFTDHYKGAVLLDNPVGYYRLGETSGPAIDLGSAGINGTYSGTPTRGIAGIPGIPGDGAMACPAAGDSVRLGAVHDLTSATAPTGMSVECWIYYTAVSSFNPFVNKGDTGWRLHRNNSNNIVQWRVSNSASSLNGGGLVNGAWNHIVGVYDYVNQLVYVNGALSASIGYTGAVATNANTLGIGYNEGQPSRPALANIDEVALYNYPLSAARIAAHYAAGH